MGENCMSKTVVDVCCGSKMFYFDKNDERVLFCDNRTLDTELCDGRKFSVHPDIQSDFTHLPFPDGKFRMVVFDPPHLRYNPGLHGKNPTGYQHIKYGYLGPGWEDVLRKGFSECFRVLEPGGFLIFKWNETDIPVSKILSLTDQKPLFGNRCGKQANTHWICFIKGG